MESPRPPEKAPPHPSGQTAALPPVASRAFSIPQLLGFLFLGAQAAFIAQTWLSDDSPRFLTPVEGLTRYEVAAMMDEHALDPARIQERYGMRPSGTVALDAAAVQYVIEHHEKPIPLSRALIVRLRTQPPGGPAEFWLWPQE